jgi:hypothetical protein
LPVRGSVREELLATPEGDLKTLKDKYVNIKTEVMKIVL